MLVRKGSHRLDTLADALHNQPLGAKMYSIAYVARHLVLPQVATYAAAIVISGLLKVPLSSDIDSPALHKTP
jgi:hypothetical protein